MMTPSGSSPVMSRIVEKRSVLADARKVGGRLNFGDDPDTSFEFGEIDDELIDRLLAEEESDPPAERIREGRAPRERAQDSYERQLGRIHSGEAPQRWEELTETDSGYLLRYDGRIYAAVEVDAGGVVERAFGSKPKRRADSPPTPAPKPPRRSPKGRSQEAFDAVAPKPERKRNAKGHYVKQAVADLGA